MSIFRYSGAKLVFALTGLLTAGMLSVAFPDTAAAALSDVTLTVGDVTTTYGDTIEVPIQVSDLTGLGVVSFQFTVTHTSSEMSFVGVDKTGTLSSDWTVISNPGTDIKISGMYMSSMSGGGTLVKIQMLATGVTTDVLTPTDVIFNTTQLTNLSEGTVTVNSSNQTPVIQAIPNVTFDEDNSSSVDLTQYISDSDNAFGDLTVTAQVQSGSGLSANLSNQDQTLTLVPDANVYGTWSVEVQATDPGGLSANGSFTVQVTSVNDPPQLDSVSDTTITAGTPAIIQLSAIDVDGDNLTFSASSNVSQVSVSVAGNTLTATPDSGWIGTATVLIQALDGTSQDQTSCILTVQREYTAGDVDDNNLIQSYDAALALQYSVGLDPLPQEDPAPWDAWRIKRADVDGNSVIAAYDASLIQQYVVSMIDSFPVENGNPFPKATAMPTDLAFNYVQDGETLNLYINQADNLYGANFQLFYNHNDVEILSMDTTALSSSYRYEMNALSDDEFNLGMMAAMPPSGGGRFLSLDLRINRSTVVQVREVINAQDTVAYNIPLGMATGTTGNSDLPATYVLHANYPNPFNPTTTIGYELPKQSQVTLTVYDMLGRRIAQLVQESQTAGRHVVQWNGTDDFGKPVGTGAYLYRIQTPEFTAVKKMVFMK